MTAQGFQAKVIAQNKLNTILFFIVGFLSRKKRNKNTQYVL